MHNSIPYFYTDENPSEFNAVSQLIMWKVNVSARWESRKYLGEPMLVLENGDEYVGLQGPSIGLERSLFRTKGWATWHLEPLIERVVRSLYHRTMAKLFRLPFFSTVFLSNLPVTNDPCGFSLRNSQYAILPFAFHLSLTRLNPMYCINAVRWSSVRYREFRTQGNGS